MLLHTMLTILPFNGHNMNSTGDTEQRIMKRVPAQVTNWLTSAIRLAFHQLPALKLKFRH
jgi:hypothetical protein